MVVMVVWVVVVVKVKEREGGVKDLGRRKFESGKNRMVRSGKGKEDDVEYNLSHACWYWFERGIRRKSRDGVNVEDGSWSGGVTDITD